MKTKEILTIIAISSLGLCLLCSFLKMLLKSNKYRQSCDKGCIVLVFMGAILLGVSQLLPTVDSFSDGLGFINPDNRCDTRWSNTCLTCEFGCKNEPGLFGDEQDHCCKQRDKCPQGLKPPCSPGAPCPMTHKPKGNCLQQQGGHCTGKNCNFCLKNCTRNGLGMDFCCGPDDLDTFCDGTLKTRCGKFKGSYSNNIFLETGCPHRVDYVTPFIQSTPGDITTCIPLGTWCKNKSVLSDKCTPQEYTDKSEIFPSYKSCNNCGVEKWACGDNYTCTKTFDGSFDTFKECSDMCKKSAGPVELHACDATDFKLRITTVGASNSNPLSKTATTFCHNKNVPREICSGISKIKKPLVGKCDANDVTSTYPWSVASPFPIPLQFGAKIYCANDEYGGVIIDGASGSNTMSGFKDSMKAYCGKDGDGYGECIWNDNTGDDCKFSNP